MTKTDTSLLADHAITGSVAKRGGQASAAWLVRRLGTQFAGTVDRLLRWSPALLFAVALFVVQHELKDHEFADIAHNWRSMPWHLIAIAILLTAANYAILAGYDLLALRFTGHRVPLRRILLTSFIGYGISNNTGHAWASGGSVRYRFYGDAGVPGRDIARISLFLALTFVIGVVTLGAVAILLAPAMERSVLGHLGIYDLMLGGSLAALAVFWAAVLGWRKPLRIKGMALALPSPALALGQTIVSTLDLVAASLVLWVFLQDVPGLTFTAFLATYAIALLLSVISQVPGGLGVFEGAFLWLTAPTFGASHPTIVAGLVLYRVVYYFIPLASAGVLLLAHDLHANRARFAKVGRVASRLVPATVPQVFSLLLFLTGGMLLVSGATPVLPANIHWLRSAIPLPLVEFSHLTGSLVGVLLLFLARAVLQRIDAAWYGALSLLAIGIVASLLKGLDWQEALVLAGMFAAIFASRRHFYRKSSLLQEPLSPSWLIMIAVVIAGTTWLGFFSYKHIEYSHELWWQFSYKNDTARFLRSLVVIAVPVIAMLVRHLLGVRRPEALSISVPEELDQAMPVIRQSAQTQGFLALLGDKALFWSDDRQAFISYVATRELLDRDGRSGRSGKILRRPAVALPRGGRPLRREDRALPGDRAPPAALSRSRPGAAEAGARRRTCPSATSRSRASGARTCATAAASSSSWAMPSRCWTRPRSPTACRACGRSPISGSSTRRRTRSASPSATSTKPMSRAPAWRSRPRRTAPSWPSPICGRSTRRRRGVDRPDALRPGGAARHDGSAVRGAHAVGPRPGLSLVQPRHGAALRPGASPARAALAQDRHRDLRPGRRVLQFRGPLSVQGEVRSGLAPALSGFAARPVGSHHPAHHHAADRRQTRSAQA